MHDTGGEAGARAGRAEEVKLEFLSPAVFAASSRRKPDYLSIVEAAYDLGSDDSAWLSQLLESIAPVLDQGFGIAGYFYEFPDDLLRMGHTKFIGCPEALFDSLVRVSPDVSDEEGKRIYAGGPCKPLSQSVEPRFLQAVLSTSGVADILTVIASDLGPGSSGCAWGAPVDRVTCAFPARLARSMERVARHVATARRLRAALRTAGAASFVDGADAVLTPKGRLLHANEDFQVKPTQNLLAREVEARAHARGAVRRSDPEQAIELWRAMVSGKWSLVDAVDTDGKRFVLARRNTPDLRDPAALTPGERRVAALAARGHSTKLIAYELGLSSPTVSQHLDNALSKLKLRSRVELVALYASGRARKEAGSALGDGSETSPVARGGPGPAPADGSGQAG